MPLCPGSHCDIGVHGEWLNPFVHGDTASRSSAELAASEQMGSRAAPA